eukprot:CAMPEP_0175436130 /NCGR_PEP_ID=MMETSP0095-20121207/54790_1 /TAXON_ID=311494 /ORGANISM="Alexandrium monilatum, Strain CCMP3105" /LENGTH=50 /DNA_ID=CAMNT_0016735751 /DNA_START=11 /DNA_END=160 /DNA_ORIENTATION=+
MQAPHCAQHQQSVRRPSLPKAFRGFATTGARASQPAAPGAAAGAAGSLTS